MHIDLYRVAFSGPGSLSIMARPRGGDWLPDEVQTLQQSGISGVVSLLTPDEVVELDLIQEAACCRALDIAFHSLPIPDRGVPASPRFLQELINNLNAALADDQHIVIHCRQGIGRASLVAASLLATRDHTSKQAFALLEQARGRSVPDTDEQRAWVDWFAEWWKENRRGRP